MKIYIDAGHGGSDPGAFSAPFAEKTLNLKAALACRDFLGAYDCQVLMSRTTDVNPTVTSRYKTAIAEKVDAVLCIHHNAGGGDGGEVWFWHTDERAKQLAALVAQEYKSIGQNMRTGAGLPEGTKASKPDTRQNFGMCREPSAKGIPAILGEFAFVDNVTDRLIVDTDAELVAQGQAYGRAVVKFLGLQLKGNTKPPEVTPPIVPSVPKAGDVFNLYGKPLFISATSKVAIRKITGTYYLYDGQKINGRYRITNSKSKVGKKPVGWYVTGWVAM